MTYYRFPDTKLFKIGFFLYLYLLQIMARSTMYTSTFLDFQMSQMIMLLLIALGGLAFLGVNRKNLKQILTDSRMTVVLLSAAVILMPMVIKQDWQLMYFTILLQILFAIFVSYFLTVQEAAEYYVAMMFALSVLTLLGQFVLKPMVNMGLLPAFAFDSPGGWHMYNFFVTFAVNKNTEMVDALRAFGIFREPGLLQIFTFIAILLNNHTVHWRDTWKMWVINAVLFLTLLITFATGGVVALALYIVFLFFDKGLYRDKRLRILAAVCVVLGVVAIGTAIAMGGTWAMELVWMIQKVFEKTDSYTSRVGSIIVDAQIFLQNPLFGSNLSDVMYSVPNNTATSPILFAVFGFAGGCFHVLTWAALLWKKERHWAANAILLVIAFMPFNTQNVIHDMFFWMFPVMALTQRGIPAARAWIQKKKV